MNIHPSKRAAMWSAVRVMLAVVHSFPARKHLVALASARLPTEIASEAWKGIGATLLIVLLVAPAASSRRWVLAIVGSSLRRPAHAAVVAFLLAMVHIVPAADHLPRLVAAPTFADAWRGGGAALAVALFAYLAFSWSRRWMRPAAAVVACGVGALGCHGDTATDVPAAAIDAGTDATAAGCASCLSDGDCSGDVCAQLGGDSYCAPRCGAGGACSPDRSCVTVTSASGEQVSVCAPRSGVCAADPPPLPDAGSPGPCGTLVAPSQTASCKCSSKTCQPNGCYGGWWCDTATGRCHAPPAGCGGTSTGGVTYVGGDAPTPAVGTTGGTVSRLYFAVVGDTRPATNDDTAGYPKTVITKVYQQMAALSPAPSFAVSTGDYMFASPASGQSAPQLDLYLGARAAFGGPLFPTMGNHECTGMTASNCGPGTTDGETQNYKDFLAKMLAPIGQAKPYYAIKLAGTDGSWTAKFLFVTGNAWTSEQGTWLDGAMSESTTYTFIVRHEPVGAAAPGVAPSEAIMAKHPYTLAIVGHTHTYGRKGRQIIVGNGGAPLTGSANYGFAMISQQKDGSLAVDMIDYASGLADPAFHFAIKGDGSPAP